MNYRLVNYTNIRSKCSIYCIKFCPFNDDYIFAVGVLNKIAIYRLVDGKSKNVKNFEMSKDEYIYTLEWSLKKDANEIMLFAGGKQGDIYNVFDSIVFGIHGYNNAIHDIKFHPSQEFFAAAYEDGIVRFYNAQTEKCFALVENQRDEFQRQLSTVTFDPTGNFIAFGGMLGEIFILNLKDNIRFHDKLIKSRSPDDEFEYEIINFLNSMCVLDKKFQDTYVDTIIWYRDFCFISKSASGNIVFWNIEGVETQKIPFLDAEGLKIVKLHDIFVPDSDLWFLRISLDPFARFLSVGNIKSELWLIDLETESVNEWTCQPIKNKFSKETIRQVTFSRDGKYFVHSTDDGFIVVYEKNLNQPDLNNNCPVDCEENVVEEKKLKKTKKKRSKKNW